MFTRLLLTPPISALFVSLLIVPNTFADVPAFERQMDIIYHKQDGFALTMDRVSPKENSNQSAIIMVLSGGWFSNHNNTRPHQIDQLPGFSKQNAIELLGRGYTLFYVVHGTQPKFTIREIHEQMSAAVRHIRHHAADYGIHPQRIGIMGGSAGGHLSLMQGTKGKDGEVDTKEQSQASSRVQAVVAYFPPTDFVNYGAEGVFFDKVVREVIPEGRNPFLQALDYWEFDATNVRLTKVTDPDRLQEHYRDIAPYYHVTSDDAPTLLLHGDADKLVPLQQSQRIVNQFHAANVPVELFVKEGADHGWKTEADETKLIANWFDKYLDQ